MAIGIDASNGAGWLMSFALFDLGGCLGASVLVVRVIRRRAELGWCGKGGTCFRPDRLDSGSGWRRMLWLFVSGWLSFSASVSAGGRAWRTTALERWKQML